MTTVDHPLAGVRDVDGGSGRRPSAPAGAPASSPLADRQAGPRRRRRLRVPRGVERLARRGALFALWELASRVGWLSQQGPGRPVDGAHRRVGHGRATARSARRSGRRSSGSSGAWPSASPSAPRWPSPPGCPALGDDLIDAQHPDAAVRARSSGCSRCCILWLGIGETVKVTLIVLGVAFPIYVNTYSAIRPIDPGYLELAARRRPRPVGSGSGGSCCPARCPGSSSGCGWPPRSPG